MALRRVTVVGDDLAEIEAELRLLAARFSRDLAERLQIWAAEIMAAIWARDRLEIGGDWRRLAEIGTRDWRRLTEIVGGWGPGAARWSVWESLPPQATHDLVITSGGVGPTCDDVTLKAVAAAFGTQLAPSDAMRGAIRERLSGEGSPGVALINRGPH